MAILVLKVFSDARPQKS